MLTLRKLLLLVMLSLSMADLSPIHAQEIRRTAFILYVRQDDSSTSPCAEAVQRHEHCLEVRATTDATWQTSDMFIHNFAAEVGFEYGLMVYDIEYTFLAEGEHYYQIGTILSRTPFVEQAKQGDTYRPSGVFAVVRIAPTWQACPDAPKEAEPQCLSGQFRPRTDWITISAIRNFVYEPDYVHTLVVEISPVQAGEAQYWLVQYLQQMPVTY